MYLAAFLNFMVALLNIFLYAINPIPLTLACIAISSAIGMFCLLIAISDY